MDKQTAYFAAVDAVNSDKTSKTAAATQVVLDIAPPESIPGIQETFQLAETAEKVYNRLLYRGQPMKHPSIFNWRTQTDVVDAATGQPAELPKNASTFESDLTLKPKDILQPFFDNYNAAMNYVARPACTLVEYIEMWHGRKIDDLIKDKVVAGPDYSFYGVGARPTTKGAIFWGRIYTLIPGPGTEVDAYTNIDKSDAYYKGANTRSIGTVTGGWKCLDDKAAQTRKNWDALLVRYRNIIRGAGKKIGLQLQL